MITEDYVSYETAKLLKEKGFDEACHAFYDDGHMHILKFVQNGLWNNAGVVANNGICVAPTLQMVTKWLRKKHNLHCDIGYDDLDWFWNIISVSKDVPIGDRPKIIVNGYACNKSPEEAIEAAIKYCLENLI